METMDEDTLDSRLSALRKLSLAGSTAADVTFRSRLRGFDRDEVRAFISNLAGDCERAERDLECAKQELDITRDKVSKTRPLPETTTRDLEQILAGGTRIANEIRETAEQESQTLITASRSRAAGIVKAAEHRATEIVRRADEVTTAAELARERAEEERRSIVAAADSSAADIIKDAEDRAVTLSNAQPMHAGPRTRSSNKRKRSDVPSSTRQNREVTRSKRMLNAERTRSSHTLPVR